MQYHFTAQLTAVKTIVGAELIERCDVGNAVALQEIQAFIQAQILEAGEQIEMGPSAPVKLDSRLDIRAQSSLCNCDCMARVPASP